MAKRAKKSNNYFTKITELGILAYRPPLSIIVPRQIQNNDEWVLFENDKTLYDNLQTDTYNEEDELEGVKKDQIIEALRLIIPKT